LLADVYPDAWRVVFEYCIEKMKRKIRGVFYNMFKKPTNYSLLAPERFDISGKYDILIRYVTYDIGVVTIEPVPASRAPSNFYPYNVVTSRYFIFEQVPYDFKNTFKNSEKVYRYPIEGTLNIFTCPECHGRGIIVERCPVCNPPIKLDPTIPPGKIKCRRCGGTGYVYEYDDRLQKNVRKTCPRCGGSGLETCPNCGGTGTIEKTCPRCGGDGKLATWKEVRLHYYNNVELNEVFDPDIASNDKVLKTIRKLEKKSGKIGVFSSTGFFRMPISLESSNVDNLVTRYITDVNNKTDHTIKKILSPMHEKIAKLTASAEKFIEKRIKRIVDSTFYSLIQLQVSSIYFTPIILSKAKKYLIENSHEKNLGETDIVVVGNSEKYKINSLSKPYEVVAKTRVFNILLTIIGIYFILMAVHKIMPSLPYLSYIFPPIINMIPSHIYMVPGYIIIASIGIVIGLIIPLIIGIKDRPEPPKKIYVVSPDLSILADSITKLVKEAQNSKKIKTYVPPGYVNRNELVNKNNTNKCLEYWSLAVPLVHSGRIFYLIFLRLYDYVKRYSAVNELVKLAKPSDVHKVIVVGLKGMNYPGGGLMNKIVAVTSADEFKDFIIKSL